MAILNNVQLWYGKLDPARPSAQFNKDNPTWELQIRTRSKKQAQEWKELSLNVKPDDDDDGIFYKANIKKRSLKKDGSPQNPVNVVTGSLEPLDPNTIGNGSIGNVRIFQYEYEMNGQKKIASMLMAVQVTELNEYQPKPREDDFGMTEMKVNRISDNQVHDEGSDLDDEIPF